MSRPKSGPQGRSHRRTEPVVGEFEPTTTSADVPESDTGITPRRRPPVRRQGRPGVVIGVVIVIVLLLAGLAWSQRATLRSWLPSTAYNDLLQRADAALAAGKLDGHDGNSARELFARANALEPDDARASSGLQRVGHAEFAQAQAALKAGDTDAAALGLGKARALLGGGSQLDGLQQAIDKTRGRRVQLTSLVDRAQQAVLDGHLDGKQGAADLYQQVLSADPGNAVARHGMDQIGHRYAAQIQTLLQQGELAQARKQIQQLSAWIPDFSALPGLRAAQAQAQAAQLVQASADMQAGRLSGDGEHNALARFRSVLAADPDNATAQAGVTAVAAAMLNQADAAMGTGHADAARGLIDQAAALGAPAAAVAAARVNLARLAQAAAPVPTAATSTSAAAAPVALTAAQHKQVQGLILRAQAAASSGQLLQPPASSAYDLYHTALALDPTNSDAMAGLADLPGHARRLFASALKAHELQRASDLLAAFTHLVPGSSAQAPMQKTLTDAWLRQARERAAAGDTGAARQALSEVQKLAPKDPRVLALQKRLGG